MTEAKNIAPGTPLPWQFEPHNGYGGVDPDGVPWPLGYISTVSPVAPIFELGTPLHFAHFEQDARYIVTAANAYPALIEALEEARTVLIDYRQAWAAPEPYDAAIAGSNAALSLARGDGQ